MSDMNEYHIHQDDGGGHCAVCGTVWPTECIAERHAVWLTSPNNPCIVIDTSRKTTTQRRSK